MKKPSVSKTTPSPKDNHQEPFLIRMSMDLNPGQYEDVAEILKTHGNSSDGRHFTRDVIVPADITLYGLHYAINRAFGFELAPHHLWRYQLPEKRLREICNDRVSDLFGMFGVFLHVPMGDPTFYFYIDTRDPDTLLDFTKLGTTYRGPYAHDVNIESYLFQHDIARQHASNIEKQMGKKEFRELTIKEFNRRFWSISIDELKFDLPLASVIAPPRVKLLDGPAWNAAFDPKNPTKFPPLTKKLHYEYDYGDGWAVEITRLALPKGLNVDDAISEVKTNYRPVCIAKEGRMLMDDVGGPDGYVDLLATIFLPGYKSWHFSSRREALSWARENLGWSPEDIPPSKIFTS